MNMNKQLTYQPPFKYKALNLQGLLLFDIDGVIRDVAGSYRRAIQETVADFSGWKPSVEAIDTLKSEGCWNNDWDASLELLRRRQDDDKHALKLPNREQVIEVFSRFYFGGDPDGDPSHWQGFICNEPLLVQRAFFDELTRQGFAWGFVSGAEPPSARFVLEKRLGLNNPALIAMGEAPDKPDPTGLLQLAQQLAGKALGESTPPIAYLGDTVADVLTVIQARQQQPDQQFVSLAVAPPHLHGRDHQAARNAYEERLKQAGADKILSCTAAAIETIKDW